MKSFFVSISLFLLFIVMTTLNYFRVASILSDVCSALDSLPETEEQCKFRDVSGETDALFRFWNNNKAFLALTINGVELRDCSTSLGNLSQFSNSDSFADYTAALSEARIRLKTLQDRESFSLANIF